MRRPTTLCLLVCLLVSPVQPSVAATPLNDDPSPPADYEGLFRVGSVWSFLAVFDLDDRRSHPAIIDIGINDGETRTPEIACTMNRVIGPGVNDDCNNAFGSYSGLMNNVAAAGGNANSPYANHGERMKNRIAATLNDGGLAGIAGQVAVPSTYRFPEIDGFLFELDDTIRYAVDEGASVINISAGFPCSPLWIGDFTGDLCSAEGRAQYCALALTHGALQSWSSLVNTGLTGVTDYLQALTPAMKTALCVATGASTLVEGDLRDRLNQAALYARDRGVPIVASAGNVWAPIALGSETLELTPMASNDVTNWGILPATAQQVIAVGAIAREAGMPNADFHGNRVDIWAPSADTSPAAAYVSGVIAVAQAVDPSLNPRTSGLSAEQRKSIVGRIRQLLKETAYDSSHPSVASDAYRRNLINPYGVVRAAAAGQVPNFESLGYVAAPDDLMTPTGDSFPDEQVSLNMPELADGMVGAAYPGSIVYVPGTPAYVDTDRLTLRPPNRYGPFKATVDLYYLKDYGDLRLTASLPPGISMTLIETRDAGVERRKRYEISELTAGQNIEVTVRGVSLTDDNLYKLSTRVEDLSGPDRVKPDPEAEADELRRFVERMEMAFRGAMPPETGCVTCNTLASRGDLPLLTQPHPNAARGMPANTRAVRFIEVERGGTHRLSLDLSRAKGLSRLELQLLDARGRTVARSKSKAPGVLAADLEPGRYVLVVAGDLASRDAVKLPYRFEQMPKRR